ncbi:GNAT family N-acetyltransferase [Streptomyces sp. NPDC051985]|uniref:GNAT family N-acetyltransferase n=1 Tax=Streptomyces sp. NPDC051985 TaxID=3155807 RepID=UPI00343A27E6
MPVEAREDSATVTVPTDVRGGGDLGTAVLDNAVWSALTGPHAHLAERSEMGVPPAEGWGRFGRAARYPDDVYAYAALADPADPDAWADLHTLVGPGATVKIKPVEQAPPGWEIVGGGTGVQFVATALRAEPDPEAVRLGPGDVPEMLDLVARTEPGPFRRRTVEMGTYLGIRHRGRLIAMAGERSEMGVSPAEGWGRLRPLGWTEISAVCTDPDHRGRGLATRLVRAVAAGIRDRGDTPFLHAAPGNATAIRLYESIGFTERLRGRTLLLRTPGTSTNAGQL